MDKNKIYKGKKASRYIKNHTQEMVNVFYDNICKEVKGYDFLVTKYYPNIKIQGNKYYKKHINRRNNKYVITCFDYTKSINKQLNAKY